MQNYIKLQLGLRSLFTKCILIYLQLNTGVVDQTTTIDYWF